MAYLYRSCVLILVTFHLVVFAQSNQEKILEHQAQVLFVHKDMLDGSGSLGYMNAQFLSHMCAMRFKQLHWNDAAYWCSNSFFNSHGKQNEVEYKALFQRARQRYFEAYAMKRHSPKISFQRYRDVYMMGQAFEPYYSLARQMVYSGLK